MEKLASDWMNNIALGMIVGKPLSINEIGKRFKRPENLENVNKFRLKKLLSCDPRFLFLPPDKFILSSRANDFLNHVSKFNVGRLVHCEIYSNLFIEFKSWKKKDDDFIFVLNTLKDQDKLQFHERTNRLLLETSNGRILSRCKEFDKMSEFELNQITNKHFDRDILKNFNIKENVDNIEKNKGDIIVSPKVIFGNEATSTKINQKLTRQILIENRGKVARKLIRVSIKSKDKNQSIFHTTCNNKKTTNIPPGGSITITISACSKTYGVFKGLVAFEFNGFGIGRFLSLQCGNPDIDKILKPSAPPVKQERKPKGSAKPKSYVPGPGIQSDSKLNEDYIRMGKYEIPHKLYDMKLQEAQETIINIKTSLESFVNNEINDEITFEQVSLYKKLHELLLWFEEIELRVNMQQYNMHRTSLSRTNGGMFRLMVPGLAEKRPSVMRGDFVLASDSNESTKKRYQSDLRSDSNESTKKRYQGVVHAVGLDHLLLKFSPSFTNTPFVSIEFEFPRRTMKILHQGLKLLEEVGAKNPNECCMKVLYPRTQHVPSSPPVLTNNRLDGLNIEQTRAVLSIVQRAANIDYFASPYVIFGPPGTGKTHTVVASIKMLCSVFAESDHFLVTAPSNTAADLLLTKLSEFLNPNQMFRFMSFQRNPVEVDNLVKSYCQYDTHQGGFISPTLSKLEGFKVIVATSMMAGKLHNYGIRSNWFKVVVLDEAGHSPEPETLATFSSQQQGTLIILAGDPQQLGPVTHSSIGRELGLGTSMLERILRRESYVRDLNKYNLTGGYNSNCVTKLIACYRCHPNIIHVPNQLFYDGDLIDATNEDARMFENWKGLKKIKFPLIFHNLQGENEQEGQSPSWFNQAEVLQTLDYVQKLIDSHVVGLDEIGIITPYQKQVKKLKSALGKLYGLNHNIMVGSCEQFQGQERKVIIISTVRTAQDMLGLDSKFNLGFVSNPKRLNVAITRAKALLIVIGSADLLCHDHNWSTLINYCIDNDAYEGELPLPSEVDERGAEEDETDDEEEESEEKKTRKLLRDLSLDPRKPGCVIS